VADRQVSLGGLLTVLGCAGGLGAWGTLTGGPMVGILGGLGGALVGFAIFFSVRAVRVHRSLEDAPAPQVLSLPPDQALSVLSAMVNRDSGRANLASEVLTTLAAISERAESDLPSAIVEAEDLRGRFPRSPAVPAELARLHRKREAPEAAAACAAQAITLALHGGMNAVAARTFAELGAERELLELAEPQWDALARVLEVRDDEDGATWVRTRKSQAAGDEKTAAEPPDA
jgi:hypothetical protein